MKKHNCIMVAVALLALFLVPAAASAAARHYWSGSDVQGYRYTFENTTGDNWTFTLSGGGKRTVSGKYTEVTRTEDFIEIQLIGSKNERYRIYKDKCYSWSKTDGEWIEMGSGKWGD